MVIKDKATFVAKTGEKDYFFVMIPSILDGDPYIHQMLFHKEEITGGHIVNIFTTEATSKIFSYSQLKAMSQDVLLNVAKEDIRELNFNFVTDYTKAPATARTLTGDFSKRYNTLKVKPLGYKYLKENLDKAFTLDFKDTTTVVSNDIFPTFVPIDTSLYTEAEDLELIKFNQDRVAGTTMQPSLTPILEAFRKGTHIAALFYGPTGTGKSFGACQIAAELGIPFASVNFSAGSDEGMLQGKFTPKEDSNFFSFVKSLFIRAYTMGYLFVADELNYAGASITGPLNSALDFFKKLMLANDEEVKMHPNFRFVVCINPGYEGTLPLNKALLSRQELVLRFRNLSSDEVATVLKNRYGYSNNEFSTLLAEFVNKLNKTFEAQHIDAYVSLREMESILKLVATSTTDVASAIALAIIDKATIDERDDKRDALIDILKDDIIALQEAYSQDSSDAIPVELKTSPISTEELDELSSTVSSAYSSTTSAAYSSTTSSTTSTGASSC